MEETDQLPACPGCGGSEYRRDSIFVSRQDHGQATSEYPAHSPVPAPSWLERERRKLPRSCHCLAYEEDNGEIVAFRIERGWTRVGRSAAADLRLDDPSVSRRHALVVAEPGKPLRVLDDRSLNGVFVNGKTIEWAPLHDGDELAVGRYTLFVLRG